MVVLAGKTPNTGEFRPASPKIFHLLIKHTGKPEAEWSGIQGFVFSYSGNFMCIAIKFHSKFINIYIKMTLSFISFILYSKQTLSAYILICIHIVIHSIHIHILLTLRGAELPKN